MASTNPYASFTITQPFLGAPLLFQPALGSKELEELIDSYVIGSACKQDKFSEVTLEFYNNATVDLSTGALTRTYNVFPSPWSTNAFQQSPTQSQSSDFSPIFTPSPGSSSATFGDSAYGSLSMTPPNRNRGARVTKKAKKDTPKAAEARLPGFSIMTKDGIDVTNSAGRGTKTKEQREHAHLMRILKACESCKKKKIKCDPSHRRSSNDMSRTSTSTTQTSSSGRLDPSPTASTPLSRATHASQGGLPPFSPSNPIDDFVLFPEDSTAWNADLSFPELETQDLEQFNFDINADITNDYPAMPVDHSFNFSFERHQSSFQPETSFGYMPVMDDQYGLDQWAEPQGFMPFSHTRSDPVGPTNNSEQLEANWQSSWLQAEPLISPRATTFADNYLLDGLVDHKEIVKNSDASNRPLTSESLDWSLLESTIITNSSSPGDDTANSGPSQASAPRRDRKRRAVDQPEIGVSSGETFEQPGHVNMIRSPQENRMLHASDPQQGGRRQLSPEILSAESLFERGLSQFSAGSSRELEEISRLKIACQLLSKSFNQDQETSLEYALLGTELQELQNVLERFEDSQHIATILSESTLLAIESLKTQLQVLSTRVKTRSSGPSTHQEYNKLHPEFHLDHLRELQVIARRLIRSLCARLESLQGEDTATSFTTSNTQMLTPGRNLQLSVSSSESDSPERKTQTLGSGVAGSSTNWQKNRSSAGLGIEASQGVIQRANGNIETLDIYLDVDNVCSQTTNERDSVVAELIAVREMPPRSMLLKTRLSDLLPQRFEGEGLSERPEQTERHLVAGMDSNRLALLSAPSPDGSSHRISSSNQTVSASIAHQERTGGLATSQQGRANIAIPFIQADYAIWHGIDDEQSNLTQTSPPAPQVASRQEGVLTRSSVNSALQATTGIQSSSSFILQALLSNVIKTQFNFAAALVILGSLALASKISNSGLDISAHLPYLIPFAFSTLIPRHLNISSALLTGAILISSFSLPIIQALRPSCNEWIENEPFAATAIILLCATLISSELFSSLNVSVIAVAALKFCSGIWDACSSGSGVGVPRVKFTEDGLGSYSSWLGMLDILSPVVAV